MKPFHGQEHRLTDGRMSLSNKSEHTTSETSDSNSVSESDSVESLNEDDEENGGTCDLKGMLYEDSNISTGATYLLILKFCLKYKLSRKAQNDLLKLISIIIPKQASENLPKNCGKLIAKIIPSMKKVEKHQICSTCNEVINSEVCQNGHEQPVTCVEDRPGFYNIPLEPQLKLFLEGRTQLYAYA